MSNYGLFEGKYFNSHSELKSQILAWGKNVEIVDLSVSDCKKMKHEFEEDGRNFSFR